MEKIHCKHSPEDPRMPIIQRRRREAVQDTELLPMCVAQGLTAHGVRVLTRTGIDSDH